jgi:hypothetical protein
MEYTQYCVILHILDGFIGVLEHNYFCAIQYVQYFIHGYSLTHLLTYSYTNYIIITQASWYFFSARIPHEESLLLREYPTQYAEYMSKTNICIPFINSSTSSGPAGNSDK